MTDLRAVTPLFVEAVLSELRVALEAKRREYLDLHVQSERDAAEFGPKSGANGRWKARAEGIDTALAMVAVRLVSALPEDPPEVKG